MKTLFSLIFAVLFVFCLAGVASAITLAWDYTNSTGDDAATGFRLYTSENSDGPWVEAGTTDVSQRSIDFTDPVVTVDTRIYFSLTAYNSTGESEKSGPASYMYSAGGGGWVGPAKPGALRVLDCNKNPNDPVCTQ